MLSDVKNKVCNMQWTVCHFVILNIIMRLFNRQIKQIMGIQIKHRISLDHTTKDVKYSVKEKQEEYKYVYLSYHFYADHFLETYFIAVDLRRTCF